MLTFVPIFKLNNEITMRKLILSFACIGASLAMVSCGSSKQAIPVSALNGDWNIVKVAGKAISPANGKAPFIGFDIAQGRIYGNSGCNRMMGTFNANSAKSGVLSFGPIAGTRMACPDMSIEQSILNALSEVKSYKTVAGKDLSIALCNSKGKELVLLEKGANGQSATLDMLNGEWNIEKINGNPLGKSEKVPFIGFNVAEKRVFGSAGCNSMTGMLEQEEGISNSINLDKLALTMMMCADMEVEQQVLAALNTVKTFNSLPDGKMGLYDANGNLVITLVKK